MEFETKQIGNAWYAMINGVTGTSFAARMNGGKWGIFVPHLLEPLTETLEEALGFIISGMDTWYTSAEAAIRLVELGAYDSPPSPHTMSNLARAGAFPGAFKLRGKGSGQRGGRGGQRGGRGGQWRMPEAGLAEFAKRRRG